MPAVGVQAAFQGLPLFAAQIGVPFAGLDGGSIKLDSEAKAVVDASSSHRVISRLLWTDGYAGGGTRANH